MAWYLLPIQPAFARRIYNEAVQELRLRDPSFSLWRSLLKFVAFPLLWQLLLALAIEFGDAPVANRLRRLFDACGEPRFFGDGLFGYFYNLGEEWPRGLYSANLMLGDVGSEGAWQRLFDNPRRRERFGAPTVCDVAFPKMGLSRAYNDLEERTLTVATYAASSKAEGMATTFRVTLLPVQHSEAVWVRCDGKVYSDWRRIDDTSIEISTHITDRTFVVWTGFSDAK